MKIEASSACAATHGVAPRERLVAALPRYAPWAAKVAPLANPLNASPALRRAGERAFDLAAARPLPRFRRDRFRDDELGAPQGAAGEVLVLADTFNRAFEPENIRAGVRVLRRLGWTPMTPRVAGRPLCCGRTYGFSCRHQIADLAGREALHSARVLDMSGSEMA